LNRRARFRLVALLVRRLLFREGSEPDDGRAVRPEWIDDRYLT